ncbi:MAG: pantetheine-phosphate adenylyltransferase [Thermoplasmata archaeon]
MGGTFDRLHRGHERLLSVANRLGGELRVGLTTADYLRLHPKPDGDRIESYRRRRRHLLAWLTRHRRRPYRIVPLRDGVGGALEADVTHLVVSEETRPAALKIQAMRRSRGLPLVQLVTVPLLRGEDALPIQSRRIRAGRIDRRGRPPLRMPGQSRGRGTKPGADEVRGSRPGRPRPTSGPARRQA